MQCPRCHHEWDVRQSPCPHCNFYMRVSEQQSPINRLTQTGTFSFDDVMMAPRRSDKTGQLKTGHQTTPTSYRPVQSPFFPRSNESQTFNSPTTDKLNPQNIGSTAPIYLNSLETTPGAGQSSASAQAETQPLFPGISLHHGRYTLQKMFHRQEWPAEVIETIWLALDTRAAEPSMMIYELNIPENASREVLSIPQTAARVFTSMGQHPNILALRDVFKEKGRSFFVFEPIYGLSLLTLMRKNGGSLPEQEVLNCCLQLTDLLRVCARQSPPLIHGNIRPEYVVKKSANGHYILTKFSVALAGGLAQIIADMRKTATPLYRTTENLLDKMDRQTDLSALLELTYYATTGLESNARTLATGPVLSPAFRAILWKGLSTIPSQRYQSASELYQDLLALQSKQRRNRPASLSGLAKDQSSLTSASITQLTKSTDEPKNFVLPIQPLPAPERTVLVPLPEELPPLAEGHDTRNAIWWFAGMIACLAPFLVRGWL